MEEGEVEPGQVKGPSGLPPVEVLGLLEVLQVLVVGPNLYRVLSAFEEVPPLFERPDDREHLLVVDLVVTLHVVEALGVEGDRVPLPVRARLREYRAGREVGAVSLETVRPSGVRKNQDRLRGHRVFQRLEGGGLGSPPDPPDVLLRKVEERPGYVRETSDEPAVEVRKAEELLHVLLVDR